MATRNLFLSIHTFLIIFSDACMFSFPSFQLLTLASHSDMNISCLTLNGTHLLKINLKNLRPIAVGYHICLLFGL